MVLLAALASIATAQTFTVRHSQSGGGFLWGFVSGPQGMVAVGQRGTILTSASGATWARRTSGTSEWLTAVTYGNGHYVAVGDKGLILLSTDTVTWTPVPQAETTARLNNILYDRGLYLAVGEAGTILTSSDARTWTRRASGVTGWLRGIVAVFPGITYTLRGEQRTLNAGFKVSGQGGTLLFSQTGETWTKWVPDGGPFTKDLEAMAPLGGRSGDVTRFVAIGAEGAYLYEDWSITYSKSDNTPNPAYLINYFTQYPSQARLRGLVGGAGVLFALGENGTILRDKVPLDTPTTANLVSGLYTGNSLFVVGEGETILQSDTFYHSRLVNLSTRGTAAQGEAALIGGFVVGGTETKTFLVRAAGPALTQFGVPGALAGTTLSVRNAGDAVLASNRGWSTHDRPAELAAAATQVGAFPFAAGSSDSALLVQLPPGQYTASVGSVDAARGAALLEAYDLSGASGGTGAAVNLSTRGYVGGAEEPMVAGFVIAGAGARRVLIRAVGPGLARFGVGATLRAPSLELFHGNARPGTPAVLTATGSWSAQPTADEVRSAAISVGAFALADADNDVAVIATLGPGAFTVVVRARDAQPGIALVEVYDLP